MLSGTLKVPSDSKASIRRCLGFDGLQPVVEKLGTIKVTRLILMLRRLPLGRDTFLGEDRSLIYIRQEAVKVRGVVSTMAEPWMLPTICNFDIQSVRAIEKDIVLGDRIGIEHIKDCNCGRAASCIRLINALGTESEWYDLHRKLL